MITPKRLINIALFALVLSASAYATDITGCGTISSGGYYTIPSDIGSSSDYTCLEIAASGSVGILCQNGATVTAQYQPLTIHDQSSSVSIYGCGFVATSSPGWMNIDCSGHGLYMDYNTISLNSGTLGMDNCTGAYFTNNTMYNSALSQHGASPTISYNTFDLAGSTLVIGIGIYGSSNFAIEGNTITGNPTYADDGIAITDTTGGYISSNTISGFWDTCIEQGGSSSNLYIQLTSCSGVGYALFGCYSNFGCSIDTLNFSTNTISGSSPVYLFAVAGDGGSLVNSSFLTNTNNTSGGAAFGSYSSGGTHFGTVSGNYLYGNTLGGAVYFDYGSIAGWSDGGANYCTSATPAAITCH